MRRVIAPPAPRVIGGHPARHSGQGNHPVKHVVIHAAVTPCAPGWARRLGGWNSTGLTGGSWHYSTDPAEVIQCSFDRYVCHAAPPNGHKIHVEMADHPTPIPKRRALRWWKSWRWAGRNHRRMLKLTAELTAELCLAYDLPLKWVGVRGLREGRPGVTGHAQVTNAFGQSTHWDPGWWPRRKFMRQVRAHAAQLLDEAAR